MILINGVDVIELLGTVVIALAALYAGLRIMVWCNDSDDWLD